MRRVSPTVLECGLRTERASVLRFTTPSKPLTPGHDLYCSFSPRRPCPPKLIIIALISPAHIRTARTLKDCALYSNIPR